MDEQESPVVLREGEDWVEGGRQEICAACGSRDAEGGQWKTLGWKPEEGCVRCSECTYINPDATQQAVRFLVSEREALVEVTDAMNFYSQQFYEIGKVLGMPEEDVVDGVPLPVVDFARALKSDLDEATDVIENDKTEIAKLKAGLKAARAKSDKAKPAEKTEPEPEPVKTEEKKDAVPEVGESNGVRPENG